MKKNGATVDEFLAKKDLPSIEVAVAIDFGSYYLCFSETEDYSGSVNKNGGFYIGRYEAGTTTVRTSGDSSATLEDLISESGKPVLKEGAYPYNCITISQAKELVKGMYGKNSEFEVGLPEGRTWDRTLRWIYETGAKTYSEIYEDSTNWGNYKDIEFTITKGKYSEATNPFFDVSGEYKKESKHAVLLTTGATERNSANKIYDLAGNVDEFTTELCYDDCVTRGGTYSMIATSETDRFAASYRFSSSYSDYGGSSVGFRPVLYLK